MNKGTCIAKKKIVLRNLNLKTYEQGISRRHKSYEQGGMQNVDIKV